MTLLASILGALSVALVASSVLQRPRAETTSTAPTLAQFDEASIPRTVH